MISLTWHARDIARKLAAMDDQVKLAQIVGLLNARLKAKDGRCGFVKDDGGRHRSGIARSGSADGTGDCVARAIAIATQKPYREVHDALTVAAVRHVAAGKSQSDWAKWARRKGGFRAFHADHGVADEVYGPYLKDLGWRSTKELPRGRGVHLRANELPGGRLIVHLRRHLTAVIDGDVTSDCSKEGRRRIQGYWTEPRSAASPAA